MPAKAAEILAGLKYRVRDPDGKLIEADERIHRFARKYAARWLKRYGSLPELGHPFPSHWNTAFVIDYASRNGEFSFDDSA